MSCCGAVLLLLLIINISCATCKEEFSGRLLMEEGRTMVHHAVKRFMIILPAIFFKLGIAFTLLVLVTIVAVNNGFIGFLLLVVGLSSVLARLQENRHHNIVPVPFVNPLPPYSNHFIDRTDSVEQEATKLPYNNYRSYTQKQITPSSNIYYSKYRSS